MLTRKNFIKKCAQYVLTIGCATSLYPMAISMGAFNRSIPILLYHRVGYTQGQLTVTPERFENDLVQLTNSGYQAIPMRQFLDYMQGASIDMPEKPVVLTFDDGYLDNYENAFPILRRNAMMAHFFVISGMAWGYTDRLRAEHIIEMVQGGMSFGSHSVSHRSLTTLSADEIQEEFIGSKTTLESMSGNVIDTIAYPCGTYDAAIIEMAQKLGYIAGFTAKPGLANSNSPLMQLRRIPIFSYDGSILRVIANRS